MKLESLTVALRPRTAWEATELGMALVRRNAGAIWKPWLLATVPLLVLLNAIGWALDLLWLAGLLMWWLKPWFDRIPLFVISRAVFGEAPGTAQTLRAHWRWGARWWLPYLLWRRLGPARPLYLPVDLLEGGTGAEARERRAALGAPVYGMCSLLTLMCVHFELALMLGAILGAIMFVPFDYLPDTFKALFEAMGEQTRWVELMFNLVYWIAVTVIEPFYVGAGFGLYLNRRTEIEGWDIELAFRRLRARLAAAAAPMLLVLCAVIGFAPDAVAQAREVAGGAPRSSAAQAGAGQANKEQTDADRADAELADVEQNGVEQADVEQADAGQADADAGEPAVDNAADAVAQAIAEDEAAPEVEAGPPRAPIREPVHGRKARRQPSTLGEVFGEDRNDDRALRKAVAEAMKDPTVAPKTKTTVWEPKKQDAPDKNAEPRKRSRWGDGLFDGLGGGMASLVQGLLWGVVVLIVGLLVFGLGRWLGWFRDGHIEPEEAPDAIRNAVTFAPEPLPDDLATAIARLWREGRRRDALALMYRAAVESMAERAGIALVPGATEAQCLRASRKLPEAEDREVFAQAVRTWQYAAYAESLPAEDDFQSLLGRLSQRFGWAA